MIFYFKHGSFLPNRSSFENKCFLASDYDIVLDDSLSVIKHTIFSALWSAVLYSSRASVFILYAQSIYGSTNLSISFILYSSCILRAIWGVIIARLCEKIGFDMVMVILSIVDCIGVLIQAIASNFILLSIGYLIMPSSMFMITWSYSSWILPYKYSVKYISMLYGIYMFLLVVGPIFAGILSEYFGGYRCVFYANLILLIFQLIYSVKFIYDTQDLLQCRQQQLIANYGDDYEQFPILIVKHNKQYHDGQNKQFWDTFLRLNIYDRIILTLITISNRFLWSFEIVILTFYVPYILNRYPAGNLINATAQLSVMGFGLGFGNVLVPRILMYGVKNVLYAKFSMMLTAGLIEIVLSGYFIPFNDMFEMIWIYCFILGLCVGLHTMSLETIILEVQPKDGVAKMAAIKSVIINILKAFNLLIIGLMTSYYSIEWFWYIICILFSVSFLASIVAVIIRKLQ